MITEIECKFCSGIGKIHSPGKNGDPFDLGVKCEKCEGSGVVEIDTDEHIYK